MLKCIITHYIVYINVFFDVLKNSTQVHSTWYDISIVHIGSTLKLPKALENDRKLGNFPYYPNGENFRAFNT